MRIKNAVTANRAVIANYYPGMKYCAITDNRILTDNYTGPHADINSNTGAVSHYCAGVDTGWTIY